MPFGRTWNDYNQMLRFGFALILITTVGRWILSLTGVPYLPRGTGVFSIVLTTNLGIHHFSLS